MTESDQRLLDQAVRNVLQRKSKIAPRRLREKFGSLPDEAALHQMARFPSDTSEIISEFHRLSQASPAAR